MQNINMIYYYFTSEFFQQLATYYSCIIYRFYVFSKFFFHYVLWKIFLFPTIWTSKLLSRRKYTHLLLRELQNYNSLLNNHQLENVGSHQKKDTPCPGTKEKPQQDGRRGKITFRIKLQPTRNAQRAHQEHTRRSHRNWDQTCLWVFDCLL